MTADEAGHSGRSTDSTAVTESDDRRPRYIVLDSDGRPAYYQEMTDEKVRFYEELAEKSAQEDREAEERAKAERPAAERAVIAMVDTLLWGDFSTFYHNHLHQHAKKQFKEAELFKHMSSSEGERLTAFMKALRQAIVDKADEQVLVARLYEHRRGSFRFILVKARDAHDKIAYAIELEKEGHQWKLYDID